MKSFVKKAFFVLSSLFLLIPIVVAQEGETITFWTIENQPDRIEIQESVAAEFEEQNPGVMVEVVPVEESEIARLMTVNLAADTHPDVSLHPVELSAQWVQDGAISAELATQIIEDLGIETFSEGALGISAVGEDLYGSVPSDGWGGLLLYRQDFFDEAGLDFEPNTYDRILEAAQALHAPDEGVNGFCGPNAADEVYTWQIFEFIALANGATFVDTEGNVTGDTEAWVETFQFYNELMSTAGQSETDWAWAETRAAYLAGNCAITIWNPFMLDEMAGLRNDVTPNCDECADDPDYLTEVTGILPTFSGYGDSDPVSWGTTVNLGIKPDSSETVQDFVKFLMSDGYVQMLSMAPEGKSPMRKGTLEDPERFVNAWTALETGVDTEALLSDFYGQELMTTIVSGAEDYSRMGFDQGYAELASAVASNFILQELVVDVLSGDLTPEEAALELQIEVEELQISLEDE